MKCPRVLVPLFLWILVSDPCHAQEQFAGPFRIVLTQIDQCDESGTHQIYATSTRISKVSRSKYLYSTNITTELNIDDSATVELDLANFGNGGWRPHYIQMEFQKFCTSMKQMMPVLYDAIMKAIHSECPVPPGTYEANDIDMDKIKASSSMPTFPYGKYRADISGRINNTLVGCIRVYIDMVPAKRSRQQKKPKNTS
ncbi:uncharacterized protein [Halyomorpha halys]|uniref:uncharacterized protein n=1 Tax=Halyomorpha halys TaxID=286706 RepID=UPI0006D4D99B